jgi:hypothetical protein
VDICIILRAVCWKFGSGEIFWDSGTILSSWKNKIMKKSGIITVFYLKGPLPVTKSLLKFGLVFWSILILVSVFSDLLSEDTENTFSLVMIIPLVIIDAIFIVIYNFFIVLEERILFNRYRIKIVLKYKYRKMVINISNLDINSVNVKVDKNKQDYLEKYGQRQFMLMNNEKILLTYNNMYLKFGNSIKIEEAQLIVDAINKQKEKYGGK